MLTPNNRRDGAMPSKTFMTYRRSKIYNIFLGHPGLMHQVVEVNVTILVACEKETMKNINW